MKLITIEKRSDRHYVCADGTPVGAMYDCFDRGTMKHPWPYRTGNNGHENVNEAVDFATKVTDYFNEVESNKDKLVPKAAGKQASPLHWGGAQFQKP